MRRLAVVFCCAWLLVASGALAEGLDPGRVDFAGGWGTPGIALVDQSRGGVEIVFSLPYLEVTEFTTNGATYLNVGIPGSFLFNNEGAPNLPGISRFVAYPAGARYRVEVLESRTVTYEGVKLLPAPRILHDSDDSPMTYEEDPAIYGVDAVYPAEPVIVSEPRKLRGVDACILGVTPFAYNPVSGDLTVYRDLRIRVSFDGGTGRFGEDRLRSRWFEPLLQAHLLNYDSLPRVAFDRRGAGRDGECEYMIFSPNDPAYLAWAEVIKDFRVKQGISTEIFNIADLGGSATGIEAKINDAYNNWNEPPVAALMLGDLPMMPVFTVSGMLSDNKYADVDGDDLPDINVARLTARNAADLELMIDKFLDYETDPPTAPNFYAEPEIAGGWQSDRWFILCCDVVHGFLTNALGKTPPRDYAGYSGGAPPYWSTNQNTSMIVDYFGPSGLGYIPTLPSHLTDWGGNALRINSNINSGAFYLLHRDHGLETGWGSPDYDVNDLSALNNEDLCFVMSINCLTGKYDYSPQCFAEAFHRMQYGALGLIAASEVSYSFVNDTFVWGMHDALWPNFDPGYGGSTGENVLMPGFAHASGKWYLEASDWPYNTQNKFDTYHLFHMHGDAFLQIYSEVPQNLTVSHAGSVDNGATAFEVTADAGAFIACATAGRVLGVAEGTGGPVLVPIDPPVNPGLMTVTVTKANFRRYEGEVLITTNDPLAIWAYSANPESVLPGPATEVFVNIADGTEQYLPGSGLVHFRFDPGDAFSTAPLEHVSAYLYSGWAGGARPDSIPEYYFSAESNGGHTVYSPADAPDSTYTYEVEGLLEVMLHDDCEADTGWTVANENVTTGAWERAVPNPTSGEQVAPLADNPAGEGTYCYVTQNGPPNGSYSDYDIDGGPTRLISPVIDLSSGDAVISLYAWYYSRDANDPFTIQVSNNNGSTWTTVLSTNASLGGWTPVSFNVADHVLPTAQVKVRLNAQDQPNNDIVEAGLDDFEVKRIIEFPTLFAGAYEYSASQGCAIPIYLDADAAYAGRQYVLSAGFSGSSPGTVLPSGKTIPLNWDWLTDFVLDHLNNAVFQAFYGNLDSEGEAVAHLNIGGPGTVPYVGQTITLAFTLWPGFDFVSTPLFIEIQP